MYEGVRTLELRIGSGSLSLKALKTFDALIIWVKTCMFISVFLLLCCPLVLILVSEPLGGFCASQI